jgi:hypothetical protein
MREKRAHCDVAVRTDMLKRLLVVGHPQVAADKTRERREKLRSENEALMESSETSDQSQGQHENSRQEAHNLLQNAFPPSPKMSSDIQQLRSFAPRSERFRLDDDVLGQLHESTSPNLAAPTMADTSRAVRVSAVSQRLLVVYLA